MNLFQLILKQMRQRLLSTCLTTLSILLAMMLATGVLILKHEGQDIFAQNNFGYNIIVGPKASELQIVFNTVYHLDKSPGNIPYSLYEELNKHGVNPNRIFPPTTWVVPIAVGDSYQGRPIVGTSCSFFGVDDEGKPLPAERTPQFAKDRSFTMAQGKVFAPNKFEAIIGSEVAKSLHLSVGNKFQATHGFPGPHDTPDIHDEVWQIVGILDETHTANDRCLFIPLMTFYAIFEHEEGEVAIAQIHAGPQGATAPAPEPKKEEKEEKAYVMDPATGTITVKLPKADWQVSALLVKCDDATAGIIQSDLRNMNDAIAVFPGPTMRTFFDQFLPQATTLLIAVATLVTIVGSISIMVSIYNSITARNREIAIMRAFGATRLRILAIICMEAGFVAIGGGLMGLVAGHLLAAAASVYLQYKVGVGIPWWRFNSGEWIYLVVILVIGLLAGLIPAYKAYQTPVAENLVTV